MNCNRFLMVAVAFAFVGMCSLSSEAQAQAGRQRREGRQLYNSAGPGPTISPYLNLTRQDGNVFDNYFLLTRPQLRQRQQNIQQNYANRQLQQNFGAFEQQARDGQFAAPAVRPTGSGGQFRTQMNYFMTRSNGSQTGGARQNSATGRQR